VTGIIGDGTGPASGAVGAFGWAVLCSGDNTIKYEVQADVNGAWTINNVACGTYNLIIRDDLGTAYRLVVDAAIVTDGVITNTGTKALNTLGTAPVCGGTIPSGAHYPYILACDYSKGLSYQTVRWSPWLFSNNDGVANDPVWLAMEDRNNMRMVVNNSSTLLNMIIGTEATEINASFTDGELTSGELNPDEELNKHHWLKVKLRGVFGTVTGMNWLFGSTTNTLNLPQTSQESDVTMIQINQLSYFPQFQILFGASSGNTLRLKQIVYFSKQNAQDILGQ
jgi:hypothetical protein